MGKRKDRKALIFYSVAVFLFFVLSFGSGITRIYGFTLFPDEFGYWSSAAAAAGYDWSEVTAYGSYYSFGYSLILTPVLWLGQNALGTYRIALGVNALLLAASFVLLLRIAGRLVPHSTTAQRVLSAGIAVCYPPWLLYMNMTMTEVLLVFCFVSVCVLLLRYLERPTIGRFAAAGVSAVYMYTVHMRSLPVLCACVGCMLLSEIRRIRPCGRKKSRLASWVKPAAALVIVSAVFLLAGCLKTMTQASVYGKADAATLSVNDYGGQISGIRALFTRRGFSELVVSLIGKVYYLSLASFGLFFAGVWFFVREMTRKDADSRVRMFSLFVLLSTVGEILVCAVFTRGYGRIDGLCYGRYDELILPVLMSFGCFAVLRMKRPFLYGAAVILSGLPVTAMLELIIKNHQLTNINGGYFIAGLSYLLRYVPFEPENYFWRAYAFAALLSAVMLGILVLIRRRNALCWLLLVWIGAEALLGMSLNEGMVYSQSRVRYRDMRMIALLEELREDENVSRKAAEAAGTGIHVPGEGEACDTEGVTEPERRIVCFGGADTGSYAAIVQFWLREETIYFFTPKETGELRERDLVLVCEREDRTEAESRYAKHRVYGIFHLYYNE